MQEVIQLAVYPKGMINCYLIRGTKKHILVDTGLPNCEKVILRQLQELGIRNEDIGLIIVSHGHIDHFGSTQALKDILNVPVLMHEADAVALETGKSLSETLKPNKFYWNILKRRLISGTAKPCSVDIRVNDGGYGLQEWGVNGRVVHTPGHTPGAVSVVLDSGEAIIMDLASSGILLGGLAFHSRMKHPPFHDDLAQVSSSIDKLLATGSQRFYLGHGYPVSRKLLQSYRDNFFSFPRKIK